MGKLTIIGNDKPVIGKQEMYSVSSVNDWLNPLKSIKNPLQVPKTHWEVMVQTKTGWRKGGSDKEGQIVPYIFGQKSLLHKGIKIAVRQGEDYGELIIHPQRAKEPKITRVELLDVNYNPIPKGKKLSYKDTIIARAYCVEMFGMNISFTLWEDDALGGGHNPTINALNKINLVPVLGRVNEKGMAEAVFRLPFYTMAVLIANARTASGDKSEGATHEYYVTADVVSKHIQKASPNVNVINPTHVPEPPRKRELPKGHTPPSEKPKTTPAPEKPKPKPDSPKFPVTTGGKKSDDPQGKILNAEFVDNNGNKLHSSKVGTTVRIKIVAKEMKNKKVTVKIWEEDNFKWTHDKIFEKDYILIGDNNYINNVQLTKKMFDKANDGGSDSSRQDYFIEVIHNNTSVNSGVMPVSIDATPTEVPSSNNPTSVKKVNLDKKADNCTCFCDRAITPKELKEMVIAMRKATFDEAGENFYKWNKDNLFTGGHEQFDDKSYEKFAEVLNKTFENYEITSCIRKIHFLGQCYHETGAFMKSVEGKRNQEYSYDPYRGRGFIHLTLQGNYQKFKDDSGYDVVKNPKLVSTNIEIAAMSSGWYWKYNDKGNINPFADRDSIFDTSRMVNKPNATKSSSINGYNQRVNAVNALKTVFQYPQNCCNLNKKEKPKENKLCPSGLEDCICSIAFDVKNGFIEHARVMKNHVTVIEHGNFKDSKASIQKIVLHRTAGGTTQACINAFKGGRKNKKGGIDYYGTHFVVGKDGAITQTANLSKITWHCAGWNSKSVGIEVVGFALDKNGKPTLGTPGQNPVVGWENLTEEQAKSVACLVMALLSYYSLDKSKIDCHEHLAAKEAGEGQIVYNAIKDYLK
ncbi:MULTISPECIES: N-acetylmuramoyl-L-alanine amidase [Elizabethkingia]|uniref:N-acetylmuramoyl-L-alanine amidase n=3 Tax=Elizabethkingia anophelis TaxID=1117645 RepID=A0A455ZIH4_9FLAO|nr:N-acetylmuramoyl-L-alanine amidase [Elizabethkingia anophelis]AIL45364.1 Lytic enzyme [Elizabethkingia anophelis NUHP1]MDV4115297.1 hypothetical protein [Elizabethkingia anophelis]DAC76588.1 TPA_exp: lytic enzyme [Elizabethkingia anophelis]